MTSKPVDLNIFLCSKNYEKLSILLNQKTETHDTSQALEIMYSCLINKLQFSGILLGHIPCMEKNQQCKKILVRRPDKYRWEKNSKMDYNEIKVKMWPGFI
jgi:hypothetical protein